MNILKEEVKRQCPVAVVRLNRCHSVRSLATLLRSLLIKLATPAGLEPATTCLEDSF
jgi:hypothetical protein